MKYKRQIDKTDVRRYTLCIDVWDHLPITEKDIKLALIEHFEGHVYAHAFEYVVVSEDDDDYTI